MNLCIGVPAATLTVHTVAVVRLCFTRVAVLPVPCSPRVVSLVAAMVQSVYVFTGRMKGTGEVRLFEGASCPFLFGVSNG